LHKWQCTRYRGERVSYETLPPASKALTGGVVGQEEGRTKIQKNFNRLEKSPTKKIIKFYNLGEKMNAPTSGIRNFSGKYFSISPQYSQKIL
jgi:hypothetical protein